MTFEHIFSPFAPTEPKAWSCACADLSALISSQEYDRCRDASSVIRCCWQAYAVVHSVPNYNYQRGSLPSSAPALWRTGERRTNPVSIFFHINLNILPHCVSEDNQHHSAHWSHTTGESTFHPLHRTHLKTSRKVSNHGRDSVRIISQSEGNPTDLICQEACIIKCHKCHVTYRAGTRIKLWSNCSLVLVAKGGQII